MYYFKINVTYKDEIYSYFLQSKINNPPLSPTLFICLQRLTNSNIPYINEKNVSFERLYFFELCKNKVDMKYDKHYKVVLNFEYNKRLR